VDSPTVAIYQAQASAYAAARPPRRVDAAVALAARSVPGLPVLDVGCGAGRHTPHLGPRVVAFDAARAMLELTRAGVGPSAGLVQGDLEALPFRAGTMGGAWANMAYHHVPRERVPMALAHLHWALAVGAPLELTAVAGDYTGTSLPDDDFPGRYFASWQPDALADVVAGAGFDVESAEFAGPGRGDVVLVRATRARSLPDTVGPGMRLLVCGLNPSAYAADRGVGYARPGNRFWPALAAAGLVCPDGARRRDPRHLLAAHGIGMTDLVKRATVASAELGVDEYRAGVERVGRLVDWLRPAAVCVVGLEGWRAAVDRKAIVGWQPALPTGTALAGVPTYVMPSTSGRVPGGVDASAAHFTNVLRAVIET
jgi:TDG/mug DNA glycosylase family protein